MEIHREMSFYPSDIWTLAVGEERWLAEIPGEVWAGHRPPAERDESSRELEEEAGDRLQLIRQ